jgi:hypothetical protein
MPDEARLTRSRSNPEGYLSRGAREVPTLAAYIASKNTENKNESEKTPNDGVNEG